MLYFKINIINILLLIYPNYLVEVIFSRYRHTDHR